MDVWDAAFAVERVRELTDDEFARVTRALFSRTGMRELFQHARGAHRLLDAIRADAVRRLQAPAEGRPTHRDVLRVASA